MIELIIVTLFGLGLLFLIGFIVDEFDTPILGVISAVLFILSLSVYIFGCNYHAEKTVDHEKMKVISCNDSLDIKSSSVDCAKGKAEYEIVVQDEAGKYDPITFLVSKPVFDKYHVGDDIFIDITSKYRPLYGTCKNTYTIPKG